MAIFKVLSGTHAGAEIELFEGTSLLGSGSECDIVLSDRMLAEEHIRFHVSQETVEVENLVPDSKLSVSGQAVAEPRFALESFVPVGIGTLFFAVGPSSAQWPQIDLASLFERSADPSQPEEHDAQDGEMSATDPEIIKAARLSQPTTQNVKQKRFTGKIFVTLLVVAILVVFYVQLEPHFAKTGKKMPMDAVSQAQTVKNLLTSMNLNLKVTESASGKLKISGIVPTKRQKVALGTALRHKKIQANLSKVSSSEDLVFLASSVLRGIIGNDAPVTVHLGKQPGTIVIKGYIPERQKVNRVLEQIRADVPGILKIEEQIETLGNRLTELQELLKKHKLIEVLSISYENGALLLKGSLPDELQNSWRAVEREFKRRYGNHPGIRYVGLLNPVETPLNTELNILGVSLGNKPFVIFKGGDRYPVGSRLESGYVIEEITKTHLRLRLGEDHYLFYLEESVHGQ